MFEDYFSEIQADMVSICLEYVEKRAEKMKRIVLQFKTAFLIVLYVSYLNIISRLPRFDEQ